MYSKTGMKYPYNSAETNFIFPKTKCFVKWWAVLVIKIYHARAHTSLSRCIRHHGTLPIQYPNVTTKENRTCHCPHRVKDPQLCHPRIATAAVIPK
jgi:hypothetical protein